MSTSYPYNTESPKNARKEISSTINPLSKDVKTGYEQMTASEPAFFPNYMSLPQYSYIGDPQIAQLHENPPCYGNIIESVHIIPSTMHIVIQLIEREKTQVKDLEEKNTRLQKSYDLSQKEINVIKKQLDDLHKAIHWYEERNIHLSNNALKENESMEEEKKGSEKQLNDIGNEAALNSDGEGQRKKRRRTE